MKPLVWTWSAALLTTALLVAGGAGTPEEGWAVATFFLCKAVWLAWVALLFERLLTRPVPARRLVVVPEPSADCAYAPPRRRAA